MVPEYSDYCSESEIFPDIQWGKQDSNLWRHKSTDLQSVPVGRFGIPPYDFKSTRQCNVLTSLLS